ncbi:hypothetical protein GA0061094_3761 [[Bacillus] enclensis]|uniref:Uncharacterized protein n=1 Tax=[Bacillus] enclensis TaxID=1402860 RepID=A0A1C4DD67_9BACI|nr:hypothetical protein [[Bacillus] enclensis]SCC29170.1 hypothetical protein GA0061094_3761 [[Bacillus] enclensis]
MKKRNLLILLMALLPWLSLPFIGSKTFKRFLPGTFFMSIYLLVEGSVAEKRNWWSFSSSLKPNVLAELPLIFGPFFIGSLWIFKFTYGKFMSYFVTNLIVDAFFTIVMLNWFKKIKYVTLRKFTRLQLSLLFLAKSISMYGFQFLYEKVFSGRFKPDHQPERVQKTSLRS